MIRKIVCRCSPKYSITLRALRLARVVGSVDGAGRNSPSCKSSFGFSSSVYHHKLLFVVIQHEVEVGVIVEEEDRIGRVNGAKRVVELMQLSDVALIAAIIINGAQTEPRHRAREEEAADDGEKHHAPLERFWLMKGITPR